MYIDFIRRCQHILSVGHAQWGTVPVSWNSPNAASWSKGQNKGITITRPTTLPVWIALRLSNKLKRKATEELLSDLQKSYVQSYCMVISLRWPYAMRSKIPSWMQYFIVYFLLPDKTEKSHKTTKLYVVTQCLRIDVAFKPEVVLILLISKVPFIFIAVRTVFETSVRSCRLNLGQCWWRQIQELGVAGAYLPNSFLTTRLSKQSVLHR